MAAFWKGRSDLATVFGCFSLAVFAIIIGFWLLAWGCFEVFFDVKKNIFVAHQNVPSIFWSQVPLLFLSLISQPINVFVFSSFLPDWLCHLLPEVSQSARLEFSADYRSGGIENPVGFSGNRRCDLSNEAGDFVAAQLLQAAAGLYSIGISL